MTKSGSKLTWLMGLVLFSAAGLVAFGLLGLQQSAERAQDVARSESQQAARALAENLLRAARDPAVLDSFRTSSRFFEFAEGGRLVVPDELTWFRSPPTDMAGERPRWPALQALERAQKIEFVESDAGAAVALLELAAEDLTVDRDRGFLLARAAWAAHRAGLTERRDALVDRFLALREPRSPDLGAVLSLRALSSGLIAPACRTYVLSLPLDQAQAFTRRLSAVPMDARRLLIEAAEDVEAHRERLRRVDARRNALLAAAEPSVLQAGSELIVWFPGGGGGQGAVVSPDALIHAVGFQRDRFHVGTDSPPEAVPSVPLIAALPNATAQTGGWESSALVPVTLTLLALAFCLGLFLTLRAVRREAQAAQSRTDFLTSVTHELKTPLASIRLLAEMLEDDLVSDPDRRQEYYRLLSGESARLTMLIENVLDLGRMERGERSYDIRETDLPSIVHEAIHLFAPMASRDGLQIDVQLDEEVPSARVDRGAMVQVLLNLLENAKKYAHDGQRIEVIGSHVEGLFRLRVRDFGPGIPEDERTAVFERFKRGAAQADGRIAGVGLGLYLARRIMQDHDGELRCMAPPDARGGACFEWEIPVSDDHAS